MPVKIPLPVTPTAIFSAVHSWIDLLSEEKYLEAYEFTMHDPYYAWTPLLIEQVINGYGLPYEEDDELPKCKVTPWLTATDDGDKYYKEIEWHTPKSHHQAGFTSIGYVCYDLPIDGRWSELTATFIVLQTADYVTLELNEIHVM